jgi:hypothetical protein
MLQKIHMRAKRFPIQPVHCRTPERAKVSFYLDNAKGRGQNYIPCFDFRTDTKEKNKLSGLWILIFRLIVTLFWSYVIIYMTLQLHSHL